MKRDPWFMVLAVLLAGLGEGFLAYEEIKLDLIDLMTDIFSFFYDGLKAPEYFV